MPAFILRDVRHQNNGLPVGWHLRSRGLRAHLCTAPLSSFENVIWNQQVVATATSENNISQILFDKYVSDVISGSGLNMSAKRV